MTMLPDATIAHLRELMQSPQHDRYEPIAPLGAGGMGIVYRAHDRELLRDVAIKVLNSPSPDSEEISRLVGEARVLAALEHPGIVPVHDVGTLEDGRSFYVMKWVRGAPLDVHARNGLSRAESLRLFRQICDAVEFAHAAGVVHRDLKPGNVMVGNFGEVLVVDWGIASRALATLPDVVAGTPAYMAPEQRRAEAGTAIDERADVFGLGGILHFLLTRSHPSDEVDDKRWLGVPKALRAISERARAHDPGKRYRSVRALADDIAAFEEQRPVSAYREGMLERLGRLGRRHETAILLVVGYLLMRVTLLALRRQ